jgi:NAD(P)-dependent dehydrogenase (short-subunit alcohol dehydrogenase family)
MSGRRAGRVDLDDTAVREAVVAALRKDGFDVLEHGSEAPPTLELLVVDTPVPPASGFVGGDVQRWYDEVLAAVSRPFQAVRAATPALRRSGGARVVVVGAGWLPTSVPRATAAAAAHGAVVALVKTLARDLGSQGISVNEVVSHPLEPARPEAVAKAVSYLVGPHGGAVTGQLVTLGPGGELRP